MKKELKQIRQTITLLNSMILSGEGHSKQSLKMLKKSFENLVDIDGEIELLKLQKF